MPTHRHNRHDLGNLLETNKSERPHITPRPRELDTLTPRQRCAQLVTSALGKSVESFVEAGRILDRYRRGPNKLPHGEFEAMTRNDLGFKGDSGPQIARMLMRIARHPILSNPKYFSVLPASYTTLYKLATEFPGVQPLRDLINQGRIHRGLKGDDVDTLEDRLIETGQDAALRYLFARISPLIYYAENYPDLTEAVDRLWVLFESYAIQSKDPACLIKNPDGPLIPRIQPSWVQPDPDDLVPAPGLPNERKFGGDYFHDGVDSEYVELKNAARWLDQFADAWQQKLIDSGHRTFGPREPGPLPDSPAAADERHRLQRDRDQRQQQEQQARDDDAERDGEHYVIDDVEHYVIANNQA